MSEINEKNALITDRKNACIKTKKQKNKCGCNRFFNLRLHSHNRLQSVMTATHAGNGGTKVVDQLLIDISTGDSSVVGSQSSARDNMQTIDSGKAVCQKKLTSETTAKTTTNRLASSTAKGQSADVLKGLNEPSATICRG